MDYWKLLQTLGPQQQARDPNAMNDAYGVPQGVVDQAQNQGMMQFGMGLLAAGMPMRNADRPVMVANAIRPLGQVQDNILSAAQARLMQGRLAGEQYDRERAMLKQQQDAAVRQQLTEAVRSLPPGQQRDAAIWYMQAGDLKKVGEVLFPQAEAPSASDRLSYIKSFNTAPAVQEYLTISKIANSMRASLDDPSAVADLDFVYGVAKALDPTSVVRESEAGMVIDSQGIAPSILGRLNKLMNGEQSLDMGTRRSLYALVDRRAAQSYEAAREARDTTLQYGQGIISDQDLYPIQPLEPMPPLPPPPAGAVPQPAPLNVVPQPAPAPAAPGGPQPPKRVTIY